VHGLSRVDAQPQFLVQLAHQRLHRRFTGIDLAAWLHESLVPRLRTSSVRP
jgi:hypothetical protein